MGTDAPERITMKIWDTHYALTNGIVERDVNASDVQVDGILFFTVGGYGQFLRKGEWHTTLESAITEAERMRESRVRSLRKQIARIETLEFRAVLK